MTGGKAADGELLILISYEPLPEMFREFRHRWQIETSFGCLKSPGFDLEETHLRESGAPGKIARIIGIGSLPVMIGSRENLSNQIDYYKKPRTLG